jgi:hypothetical protein
MYKFHLKFQPTSRLPMIEAIMFALGIDFVSARDVLDNGLVVNDTTMPHTIKTMEWAVAHVNVIAHGLKATRQPGVPYTPFACSYDLSSYECRPVSVREPIVIKELIDA